MKGAGKIGGFKAENLIRVEGGPGISALTPGEATELLKLVKGQSDLYLRTSGAGLPTLPSYSYSGSGSVPPAGSIWFDNGEIKFSDGVNVIPLGSGGSGGISNITGDTYISVSGDSSNKQLSLNTVALETHLENAFASTFASINDCRRRNFI